MPRVIPPVLPVYVSLLLYLNLAVYLLSLMWYNCKKIRCIAHINDTFKLKKMKITKETKIKDLISKGAFIILGAEMTLND